MLERENILNKLVDMLSTITETNGYPITVQTVTRKLLAPDMFDVSELPAICVNDGREERIYHDPRVIHNFYVLLRCWIYNEENTSTDLNTLLQAITDCLLQDPYLGNLIQDRVRIVDVTTDSGILQPFGLLEITLKTTFYRQEVC